MKTVFIRAIEAPIDDKAAVLRKAARGPSAARFEGEPSGFAAVPGSPFSYWVSDRVRRVFTTNSPFKSEGRVAAVGLQTSDDFRFARLAWEIRSPDFVCFAKGGAFSPFYAPVQLRLQWRDDGRELKSSVEARYGTASKHVQNQRCYFRPGLTWPLRSQRGFGMRAMPAGCVFGHKGPSAFSARDNPAELLALLAIATSSPFRYLVGLQMAFGAYEVGVIQRTPVPSLAAHDLGTLAHLALRGWSLKRSLDTPNETSQAFLLPSGLNERAMGLDHEAVGHELETIQAEIDDLVFDLYGIGPEDRAAIESSATSAAPTNEEATETSSDEDDDDEESAISASNVARDSWLVGVSFGRFDPRLATGERAVPPEPEPFDQLPSLSPGMYPDGEETAERPDILVDDEGHPGDLAARTIAIAERVKVDVPENLRGWLAKEFFPLHIKMYSKSRRKAPIYWQLATPSASYSVWLYIHAFSKDTLFRVQNDYVAPKLAHEERLLDSLTSELRDGATAAQRKRLAAQETLVEELRAFLDEVKRVAPLWKPNLDDGVVINFAPLWRLVPQNKSWEKELKSTWGALCEGKYDWAHLAIHLWPERVVPKCAKDRSLAIAHGLEDVFWVEGTDGKWAARKPATRSVDELVRERTSPAVKAALKSLLDAPVAQGGGSRGRRGRTVASADEGGSR
jgi:hypothetical protein